MADKKILLHSCCAPCSGAVIEKLLKDGEDFAVFFSNSNIDSAQEYELRLKELRRYCSSLGVKLIEDVYDHSSWLQAVSGLEDEPERGHRCEECFRYRLDRAAQYADKEGFDLLATSLASSRWKNLDQVNSAGLQSCESTSTSFLAANWRKSGLQERRNQIIKEQNFYNQTFCGCEFSRRK